MSKPITTEDGFIFIPADEHDAIQRRIEAEARRRRKDRYYQFKKRQDELASQPVPKFIMWDGEGPKDTAYSLFGNSMGMEICHQFLSTIECLTLIIEAGKLYPNDIHFWFGGKYDASMILNDLGEKKLRQLARRNRVVHRGFAIHYVPGKWFEVYHDGIEVRIFDVHSFFATSFIKALEDNRIGPWRDPIPETDPIDIADLELADLQKMDDREIVSIFKNARSEFLYRDIDLIRIYWKLELKYGVRLMNKLRAIFVQGGYEPQSWHGPGALARLALQRHGIKQVMSKPDPRVRLASQYAYAGGRFEMVRGGLIKQKIYNADLNSAYPHFARDLPNLNNGEWRHTTVYEPGKFGMWHINYKSEDHTPGKIYPLFRRLENHSVIWPSNVEGWYHRPEAELVVNDPDAEFIEGWVFDEANEKDRPFAWLEDYYHRRMLYKNNGDSVEKTYKLIINSVYGQLAQRAGWDKQSGKSPNYHQLEWAGYITSACRAEVYKVARKCGNELVSIDTDGIYATCPMSVDTGSNLGQWALSDYEAGLFWSSGVYILDNGNGWQRGETKSRGIPRGNLSYDQMYKHMQANEPLVMKRKTFIGFGIAINHRMDELNTWQDQILEYRFGGSAKRYHHHRCEEFCPDYKQDRHEFKMRPIPDGMSVPHPLPWLEDMPDEKKNHEDLVMFDANGLDEEDRLVLSSYL